MMIPFLAALLAVNDVSPRVIPSSEATAISIEGSGFETGDQVLIGGLSCADLVVRDEGTILCAAPPHDQGAVDLVVIPPSGAPLSVPSAIIYYDP
jgi:hypothetical protein